MTRQPGLSVRMKLTLSYAGLTIVAGGVLLVVLLAVLRYLPAESLMTVSGGFSPSRRDLLDASVKFVVAGLGFLVVVGLVGGWFLAGRMLRPLVPISEAARAAAGGSLAHRIALPGPQDEFRELADTFDDMLERLESAFEEQQRFTANASHELRTPLAVTRAMLEAAEADPERTDLAVLLPRLAETNERAAAMVEALLQLARIERGAVARDPCELAAVVRSALAEHGATDAEVPDEPVPVTGDRVLLAQLVTNLLRNAHQHGLAEDPRVWVRLRGCELQIENTGPELNHATVDTFTEPFVRGAGRARQPGSGLGLAIVASIARAHGATLRLEPRDTGGLVVTVAFGGRPTT